MQTSRRPLSPKRIGALLLAAVAFVLVTATVTRALHRFTPPFVQVTSMTSGGVGQLTTWSPDQWVYDANGDVVGNGNASWQIFVFSLLDRDFAGLPGNTQITFGAHNARYPSITRNGQFIPFRVVFEADGDLCADSANNCDASAAPTAGRQIFMFNSSSDMSGGCTPTTCSGKTTQITKVAGDCLRPRISGNGRFVVFESAADVDGSGASGGVTEIYQADLNRLGAACTVLPCPVPPGNPTAGTGIERLTNGGGTNPTQSFNGQVVAFESRGDLANNGANPGIQQIYIVTAGGGGKSIVHGTPGVLTQVTSGIGDARSPVTNQNGSIVAYEKDVSTGGQMISQIFYTKIRAKKTETVQVTDASAPSFAPSLGANGRRLVFTSDGDLLGNGTPGNEIYTYNIRRAASGTPGKALEQITAGPRGATAGQATLFILLGFTSNDDIKGNGNAIQQFFVANPFREAPPDFKTPFPGTPTPVATPGVPVDVELSLVTNGAQNNGDGTLTTVVAAVVTDAYGNAVPDGVPVDFSIKTPVMGVVVTDGTTNGPPTCDVSNFKLSTGVPVVDEPGVAHGCIIYPLDQVGTARFLSASVTASGVPIVVSAEFVLPAEGPAATPTTGGSTPTPAPTATVIPTVVATTTSIPTVTLVPSSTPTPLPTDTPMDTPTPVDTGTPQETPTPQDTPTP